MPSKPTLRTHPRTWAYLEGHLNAYRYSEERLRKRTVFDEFKKSLDFHRIMQYEVVPSAHANAERTQETVCLQVLDALLTKEDPSTGNMWIHVGGSWYVHEDYASVDERQKNWRLRYQSARQDQAALERAAYKFEVACIEHGLVASVVRDDYGNAVDVLYAEVGS